MTLLLSSSFVVFSLLISNAGYSLNIYLWAGILLSVLSVINIYFDIRHFFRAYSYKSYFHCFMMFVGVLGNLSTLYICAYVIMLSIGAIGVD